jgi:hypothetical protein
MMAGNILRVVSSADDQTTSSHDTDEDDEDDDAGVGTAPDSRSCLDNPLSAATTSALFAPAK